MEQEYIVACILGPIGNEDRFVAWPPHITVIPWFEIDNENLAIAALHRVAVMTPAFTVHVQEGGYLGPRKNVPVHKVQSAELHTLHELLAGELENLGAEMPHEHYMHDRYIPHITKKSSSSIHENDTIKINKLYLIRAPQHASRLTRLKRLVLEVELQ